MAKPKANDMEKYILNRFKQEYSLPQKKLLIHSCTNPLLVCVSQYILQFVAYLQVVVFFLRKKTHNFNTEKFISLF